jgi:DNA-binding MarR family transcriptional regulator
MVHHLNYLGYARRVAASTEQQREAVRALARLSRLLERASGELSLPQYRVLAAVAGGDERASRVAQRLAMGKPSVSAAVEALSQRGLLIRDSVDADLRATALRLSDRGRAVLDQTERAMLARVADVWDRLPDRDALIDSLRQVGPAMDAASSERRVARPSGESA